MKKDEQQHYMLSYWRGFIGNPVILLNMVFLVIAARASAEFELSFVDL